MNTYEYILKKYNINVGRQHIIEIPNMARNHLAELFVELEFNLGAEIGVALGHYSEILCKANPKLHLYSIDPWKITAYEPGIVPAEAGNLDSQELFDSQYKSAQKRLAPYNCTIMRKSSMSALKDFADNSLDFVYIDANHDFVNFTNDLHYWKKKVRVGGIVSGHDYKNFPQRKHNHVKWVVDAYFRCYRMIPYFIVGAVGEKGVTRDHAPSWFWVKT